jgi:hypothetical protein
MLFIEDTERVDFESRGVKWQIGPVPIGKLDEFELAIAEARRPLAGLAEGTPEHAAAMARWWVDYARVAREVVRWGVKGWDAGKLPRKTERVESAGRSFDVLAPVIVEALSRVAGGALVSDLAAAVLKENRVDGDALLGFK